MIGSTGFVIDRLTERADIADVNTSIVYEDVDGVAYLPLLVQRLLVYEASADQLRRARARAARRGVRRHP